MARIGRTLYTSFAEATTSTAVPAVPLLRKARLNQLGHIGLPSLASPSSSAPAASCSSSRSFSSTVAKPSGSNKWSKIRHKKAALDSVRSNTFGRLTSDISAAIKAGGAEPNSNARLAMLIKKAKDLSYPKDRLDSVFAKAQSSGDTGHHATYEALGPDGVAMIIECTTDSLSRTHAKIKETFNRSSSSAGARLSSVGHLFQRRGVVRASLVPGSSFDDVFELALDAGAEDVRQIGELETESEAEDRILSEDKGSIVEVLCPPSGVQELSQKVTAAGHELLEAETRMMPTGPPLRIRDEGAAAAGQEDLTTADGEMAFGGWVSEETVTKLDKLVATLEDSADCQRVW